MDNELITIVNVGEAAKLSLVTRGKTEPNFVICGPRRLVEEALINMGIDPFDPRGVLTDCGHWIDIALFNMPEIEEQKVHSVVESFGIEDRLKLG